MIRTNVALLIALLLTAGCSSQNTNMSTLQFSGETAPYPEDYTSRAAKALERQVGPDVFIQISKPRPALGASVFGHQRWYVCVRDVPNSAPVRRKMPVWDIAEEWLDPSTRRSELVLFYNVTGLPSVRKSNGSPLCDDADFETISLAGARRPNT